MIIYFGAAGSGKAYSSHSGRLPDFFVDNDVNKWGTKILNREVRPPSTIAAINMNYLENIVITSDYIETILPQLLKLGVPRKKIKIPPKSMLGTHPFIQKENRVEATLLLSSLMEIGEKFLLVAVGGSALGFYRDSDFIHWDSDIDLFASKHFFLELLDALKAANCSPYIEGDSIKACFNLSSGETVPLGIDFFDPNLDVHIDSYQDHKWIWPTQMFTKPKIVSVHSFEIKIPRPPEQYLAGVYGKSWNIEDSNFSYFDYNSIDLDS